MLVPLIFDQFFISVDREILKSVINTSLPFAMEQLCFNGGGIIVSMFIVKLGTESIEANAVSNSTLMVFYSMGLAVSNLSVTIVGQCIGAKDKKMARYYGKKMVWLGEVSILVSLAALLPNVLRAAGDVNFTSYVSLITMWLIRVGCSYAVSMKLGFGIESVWICMGVEWLIRSVIFMVRFHSDRWLNQKTAV